MESYITKCLISLKKVSNLSSSSRIDTTKGDIDEFVESKWNNLVRMCLDSRTKALKLLRDKFDESKEAIKVIIETNNHTQYLKIFRKELLKSKEGLTLYKTNKRYSEDKEIKTTIDHIIETEIPIMVKNIEEHCRLCNIEFSEEPQ